MLRLETLEITQGAFRLDADLTVETGTLCAIIGPSGAGKSTLLATIAGFLAPSSGRIWWNETELTRMAPSQRPVSMIFQDNNLFPHLSAAKNIDLGLPRATSSRAERKQRVSDALAQVGLAGMEARLPGALSGGQQSRVALARALVQHRPLLLLDEPFSALGPGLKDDMIALVRQLAQDRGLTTLMITHQPNDAIQLGGPTIVVAAGKAHPPVATAQLLENPPATMRDYFQKT